MRFIVDTHLPPALARLLVTLGHEAEHVLDLDMGSAKDSAIWRYAQLKRAIIVSKDEDFVVMRLQSTKGPQIVWVRCGNVRRKGLLDLFTLTFPRIEVALAAGEAIVEIA